MFRWAVRKGYLARNPISEDSALKREKHARRSRRLGGDEEQRLIGGSSGLFSVPWKVAPDSASC